MADEALVLANSTSKKHYEAEFYSHLSTLASVEFGRTSAVRPAGFKYDFSKYVSLQQAAFEEAPKTESEAPKEVNWSAIDSETRSFGARLSDTIPSTARERLRPLVDFSTDCFEKWSIYRTMYRSGANPWTPTIRILGKGRLIYVSDESDKLANLSRSVSPSVNDLSRGNVGIVVKGKSPQLGGFVIDNRYEVQERILWYLHTNARGHQNPVSLKEIGDYLQVEGINWRSDAIQIKGTTPLKKAGVVGSTTRGFFVIESEEDLIAAYCFHLTKTASIGTILRQYRTRARAFGLVSLDEECGGAILNEIP